MLPPPPISTLFPYTTLFRSLYWPGEDPVGKQLPGACPNAAPATVVGLVADSDRKSTRLNSSHQIISYAVFCLKKKKDIAPGGEHGARVAPLRIRRRRCLSVR